MGIQPVYRERGCFVTEVVIEKRLRINIFKLSNAYYLKHFFDDLGLFREFWKSSGLFSIVSDYYHIYKKSECRV
jgi:hypothetical protein